MTVFDSEMLTKLCGSNNDQVALGRCKGPTDELHISHT